ncbi:RICIN domain-containing protein [Micromonospora sp. NPDC005189]|uniref:RICIN domain-containing protein n=1 Tax=unclassified Micromonospora TaxID=2617518 RepID=UPI0033BB8C8D
MSIRSRARRRPTARAGTAATAALMLLLGLLMPASAGHAAATATLNYPVNQAFNGSSTFLDKSGDLPGVANLTQGAIAVRFRSTSTAVAKSFFSASHTADESSNLSFSLNGGSVYFENRENGAYATQVTSTGGPYNDGVWHTAILTVGAEGTRLYVDGTVRATHPSTRFFANVRDLNGMWVGRNVDAQGAQWHYSGDLDYVRVYGTTLTAGEISDLSMRIDYTIPFLDLKDDTRRQVLTDRQAGQYLGHPDTVLLDDGRTMFAVYPQGHGTGPIVLKRSDDGGRTWTGRLPTPATWATSKETPTLYKVVKPSGATRLLLVSGLPASPGGFKTAYSDDNGRSWSEFTHHFADSGYNGWVAHATLVRLKKADGSWDFRYMGIFHDGGYNNWKTYLTFDASGNAVWSTPTRLLSAHNTIEKYAGLCEIEIIRSPDGRQLALLARAQHKRTNAMVAFSNDEGTTWTEPREMQGALMGERHAATYDPASGRLVITFRDIIRNSVSNTGAWMAGDWVAWVGTYDDLVNSREGQYRVRLLEDFTPSVKSGDTGYAGNVVLPDGTFVLTSYGYFDPQDTSYPYIMTTRFSLKELDALNGSFDPNANYTITNRASGKVMEVAVAAPGDGGDAVQWADNGGLHQKWSIVAVGDGYYRIVNRRSGRALDVAGNSTADGADVIQWTYTGSTNQQWRITRVGTHVTITNRNSARALDLDGTITDNGADVIQRTASGATRQQWSLS